jgi:hypothetical protein
MDLRSFAPERDDGPGLGEFGAELGDDEISGKESDAECDGDADILVT